MANNADGEVVYRIVSDDSELESGLDRARQRAEQSARRTAQSTEEIEETHEQSRRRMREETTEHNQEQNEEQEHDNEESYGRRESSARKHTDTLKGIASGTAKAIGSGMLATGAAVIGIGATAVNSANDMQKAMNQYIASTGKSTEETERYKKVMEDIYSNNYGDSFEDIGQAMSKVTQQMGDLNDSDLQRVTEGVYTLSDVFETDFNETLRGVDQLMTQFGISADEALDLMATGSQKGLNYTDELGDNIAEYGGKFKQAGYSAEEYFQLLKNGTDGGAYNLDKVNDAINEVTNKLADGSIESSLQIYSDKTKNLFKEWQKGGASQKEVIDSIVNDISSCKNEQEALTMAATAFGTMGEDANLDFIKSLTSVGDAFNDIEGEMKTLQDVKYDDLGSVFEGLKRAVEVLIIPLGEQLIPLLSKLIQDVLPLIEENLPPIMEIIGKNAEQLILIAQEILPVLMEALEALIPSFMQMVQEILPVILQLISDIAPLLADLISAVLPILVELFESLLPPLLDIISTALPPLLDLIKALLPIFQSVIDLLMPIINLFIELLTPIINLISSALIPLVNALSPIINVISSLLIPILNVLIGVFEGVFSGIVNIISDKISVVSNILNGIIDFIKNVFTGNWKGAWEAVVNIFSSIIEGIGNIFKAPLNFVIDGINGFIGGLNKIQIPDWVPAVGGKGIDIPKIPRLKVGMDYVPSDYFPAFLDYGERVLTQEENTKFNALGGIEGIEKALSGECSIMNSECNNQSVNVDIGGNIYTTVELDSKVVGKSVAPIVGSELAYSGKGRR